jgi:hypothetical protein
MPLRVENRDAAVVRLAELGTGTGTGTLDSAPEATCASAATLP